MRLAPFILSFVCLAARAAPLVVGIASPKGEAETAIQKDLIQKALAESGREVVVKVYANPDTIAQMLLIQRVDIAWVSPASFLRALSGSNPTPLASIVRFGATSQRAVFVVGPASKAKNLADLKGSSIAWLGSSSSTTTLFARALLKSQKLEPESFFGEQKIVAQHAEACRALLDGKVAAIATYAYDTKDLKADGCRNEAGWEKLRPVAWSDTFPSDFFAAREELAQADILTMRTALLGMGKTDAGKAALAKAFEADRFEDASTIDLESVKDALKSLERGSGNAPDKVSRPATPTE